MDGPLLKAQRTQVSLVVFMPGTWGVRLMAGCIPPCRYGILNIVLWRSSMRRLLIAFSLLALCGLASAQVTVISGYASNWAPGYSVYQTPGAYAARPQQRPARTITNDDIARLNQQNGTVQFRGKTEKIE